MRGRRAFMILTIYVLLLGGFAWMVELLMERSLLDRLRRLGGLRLGVDRPGHLRRPPDAPDPAGRRPGTRRDGRRDQQRARAADAGPAHRDADLVARDRARQAAQRAGLGVPADPRLDPADGPRLRLRRRRPGRRPARLRVLFATVIGLGSFGLFFSSLVTRTRPPRRSPSSASSRSRSGRCSSSCSGPGWPPPTTAGASARQGQPPEVIVYLNPFIAQADVLCGTETSFGAWCSLVSRWSPARTASSSSIRARGPAVRSPAPGFASGRRGRRRRPVRQPRSATWPPSVPSRQTVLAEERRRAC